MSSSLSSGAASASSGGENGEKTSDIRHKLDAVVRDKYKQSEKIRCHTHSHDDCDASAALHSGADAAPEAPQPWERERLWRHVPSMVLGDSMTSGEFMIRLSHDLMEHNLVKHPQYEEIRIPEDHREIGNRVWDGAVVFTRWLEESLRRQYIRHEDDLWWCLDVKDKRLLEIGAGTGVIGIISAILGAKYVMSTDLPSVVATANQHVHSYGLQDTVSTCALEWGNHDHTETVRLLHQEDPFDAIIASDLAAPVSCVDDLLYTLRKLMHQEDGIKEAWVLLQDHREFADPFVTACRQDTKLKIATIPMENLASTQRSDRHTIYKISVR